MAVSLVAVLVAGFLVAVLVAGFLAAVLVAGFLAAVFLVAGFLAAVFLAAALVAGALLAVFFGVGSLARRSARRSAARSIEMVAGSSARRSDALLSPSVTYGPKRPSFRVTSRPVAGSTPTTIPGLGAAAPRRPLGWANSTNASSMLTVKIEASSGSERESLSLLM